jgi:hypothetical protein
MHFATLRLGYWHPADGAPVALSKVASDSSRGIENTLKIRKLAWEKW